MRHLRLLNGMEWTSSGQANSLWHSSGHPACNGMHGVVMAIWPGYEMAGQNGLTKFVQFQLLHTRDGANGFGKLELLKDDVHASRQPVIAAKQDAGMDCDAPGAVEAARPAGCGGSAARGCCVKLRGQSVQGGPAVGTRAAPACFTAPANMPWRQ